MTMLAEAAAAVLATAEPAEKCRASLDAAAAWQAGRIVEVGQALPPDRPARPAKPEILPPRQMPRRSFGGINGKMSLLHALAHIEFNAIDLAWDIVARFTDQELPVAFYDDWVRVAAEETEHFRALVGLLRALDSDYGHLPAHDGLWDAARKTTHDLRARLAVVPLVLEARALDTAPTAIARLQESGDEAATIVLNRILTDEIGHVGIGVCWFEYLCERAGEAPADAFQTLLREHFPKGLKAPFNHTARGEAGFPAEWYEPMAKNR